MYVCAAAAAALRYDLIFAQRKQSVVFYAYEFSCLLFHRLVALAQFFFPPLPFRPDYYYFGTKKSTNCVDASSATAHVQAHKQQKEKEIKR